jgi:hypothetical protein
LTLDEEEGGGGAESSAVSWVCCPPISEGLDDQQGLQGNRVAAIAKTLRSNRAGCITKAVRLAHSGDVAFVGVFLGVARVQAVPLLSMAVFLESQVDPLAIIDKCNHPYFPVGFTTDRAAVGVVIEQNEQKRGLPP